MWGCKFMPAFALKFRLWIKPFSDCKTVIFGSNLYDQEATFKAHP